MWNITLFGVIDHIIYYICPNYMDILMLWHTKIWASVFCVYFASCKQFGSFLFSLYLLSHKKVCFHSLVQNNSTGLHKALNFIQHLWDKLEHRLITQHQCWISQLLCVWMWANPCSRGPTYGGLKTDRRLKSWLLEKHLNEDKFEMTWSAIKSNPDSSRHTDLFCVSVGECK